MADAADPGAYRQAESRPTDQRPADQRRVDRLVVTRGHACWPASWEPERSPLITDLHVDGDATALRGLCIGVVGTRQPTARGLEVARVLASQLAAAGCVVVSGLARGIDAAAHRGALAAGGRTVAVMATGADLCYPQAHRGMLREIRANGCSVTPFPPGTPPLRHHFPMRNQVLALIVRAVVVVEAPSRSGALNTAREAADADREVLAVPGPVDVETSRGCHRLLRDGAGLVESAADILAALGSRAPLLPAPPLPPPPLLPDHAAARWLWRRLDLGGCGRDELRREWAGDERSFVDGLTALEMGGLIRRLPGGRLARKIWTA